MKIIQNHFLYIIAISILLFLPFLSEQVFAAAWLKKEGEAQLISTYSGYISSEYYDKNGAMQESGNDFTKMDINPYAEYGLTDDITIGLNSSLQSWNYKKSDRDSAIFDFRQCGILNDVALDEVETYVFEAEIFARKKLWEQDDLIFSVQPLIKTPCLVMQNGKFDFNENNFDLELRFLAGYGFKFDQDLFPNADYEFLNHYHFLNFETAYRRRNGDFADQIKFDSTLGLKYKDDIMLLGQVFTVFSNGDEDVLGVVENGQVFTSKDNYYSVKAQISAVKRLRDNKSVQLGVFNEVLGKNSGSGTGALISMWYEF